MDNMNIWDKAKAPPANVLKTIGASRLKGMTDIKPQWRYQVMTEIFGPCGVGWKYTLVQRWLDAGSDGQLVASVAIDLYIKYEGEWSDAIPGLGGSTLVAKETKGLHTSDEAYKMALTDALSVAMAKLGVAAEIYMGNWNGSKYTNQAPERNLAQEAGQMLVEMYGKEEAPQKLSEITAWVDKDGIEHLGKSSFKGMSEKQVQVIYGKIKVFYLDWKENK